MVRKTRLCLLFSLSLSRIIFGKNEPFYRTFLSLVLLLLLVLSARSIEPAAVKFFTFRFYDEDDDDVNDDVTVRANARRVLLRGRMMINWFLSICFFYAL